MPAHVASDGVRLHVEVGGPDDAATVVLVHGLAASISLAWTMTGVLERLTAAGVRTIAYDARGQVQVDAILTSPDSQDGGPGSCTYSPYSAMGMILAHRQSSNAPQNGGFFTFLMQSFLFP